MAAVQTVANARLAASLTRETNANAALNEANGQLTKSRAAVQARYELATDAIKTFHTGVSEDFLLKEEKFKDLRNRLLKSASDFYGKLGALLGKETDLASRRALAQANFELADLTDKVGRPEDALAAHRQVLAAREALAAESQADPEIKADVGRSLTAIASLLQSTGKTKEAEETYRKAETLLAGLAPTIAEAAAVRAALAECRWRLGWLLSSAGRYDEALSLYRLARADLEALAAAPGATAEIEAEPGGHGQPHRRPARRNGQEGGGGGRDPQGAGAPAEAGRRQPRRHRIPTPPVDQPQQPRPPAVAVRGSHRKRWPSSARRWRSSQKLADDNPAVTEFRSDLASGHNNLGVLLLQMGKPVGGGGRVPQGAAAPAEAGRRQPRRHRIATPRLATGHSNLGYLLRKTGKPAEAEAELRQSLAISQKLADDNPKVPDFRDDRRPGPEEPRRRGPHARPGGRGPRRLRAGDRRPRTAGRGEPGDDVVPQSPGLVVSRGAGWPAAPWATPPEPRPTPGGHSSLLEGLPSRTGEDLFEEGCCHALLAGLAGQDGAGVSAAEGEGRDRPGDGPAEKDRRHGLPRRLRLPDRLGPRPAPPAGGLQETARGAGEEISRQAEVSEPLRDRGGFRIGREWKR